MQCLNILRDMPASRQLTDALLTKASDQNSPLRYGALRQLEKSAADPRVTNGTIRAPQAEGWTQLYAVGPQRAGK